MQYRLLVQSKLFGLRGEDEHRSLVREQFEFNSDQQGWFLRFRGPRVFITVNCKTWLVVLLKVTLYSRNKLHQDGWGHGVCLGDELPLRI